MTITNGTNIWHTESLKAIVNRLAGADMAGVSVDILVKLDPDRGYLIELASAPECGPITDAIAQAHLLEFLAVANPDLIWNLLDDIDTRDKMIAAHDQNVRQIRAERDAAQSEKVVMARMLRDLHADLAGRAKRSKVAQDVRTNIEQILDRVGER